MPLSVFGLPREVVVYAVDHGHGDVSVGEDEVGERACLGLADRQRTGGAVELGEVVREAAVQQDAGAAVLVGGAVAIVVEPLTGHREHPTLALLGVGTSQQPRLVGVDDPAAVGVRPAHLRDLAVAVEVVGRVLVGGAVAVEVEWLGVARPCQRGAVGVELRHDVDHACVEQGRDAEVAPVAVD